MSNVGRLLTTLGWLWLALAIFGGVIGIERLNFFPAFILIFVGRAIRRGNRETQDRDTDEQPTPQQAQAPRPLNTERKPQQASVPARKPQPPAPMSTSPVPPPVASPSDVAEPDADSRGEMLEHILEVGLAASSQTGPQPKTGKDRAIEEDHAPMTSAEMIARARKRWDRTD